MQRRLDPAEALRRQNLSRIGGPAQPAATPQRARKSRPEPNVPAKEICSVIHCDPDLIVVDKAAGYPVVPTGPFHRRSVLMALAEMGYGTLFPISLLDAEATGLVLLSRSETAAQALRWNWRSKLCERQFVGVVQGEIVGARGRVTFPIGAVRTGSGIRHEIVHIEQGGRPATTAWKLLARGRGMSRLLITLQGGRVHQVRIHMAAIGFPLVGDRVYSRARTDVPLSALIDMPQKYKDIVPMPPHQIALHCSRIAIPHPITNQPMEFVAPVPRNVLQLQPGAWIVDV